MRQTLQLTDLARMEPFIQGVRFRPEEVAVEMKWAPANEFCNRIPRWAGDCGLSQGTITENF
jgi:hypothetical protein